MGDLRWIELCCVVNENSASNVDLDNCCRHDSWARTSLESCYRASPSVPFIHSLNHTMLAVSSERSRIQGWQPRLFSESAARAGVLGFGFTCFEIA